MNDLVFVAHHADGIEFSFVQCADDVAALQDVLAKERPESWRKLGLVLKIETNRAVDNLRDFLVRAAGRQPTAIMITTRGERSVGDGFMLGDGGVIRGKHRTLRLLTISIRPRAERLLWVRSGLGNARSNLAEIQCRQCYV